MTTSENPISTNPNCPIVIGKASLKIVKVISRYEFSRRNKRAKIIEIKVMAVDIPIHFYNYFLNKFLIYDKKCMGVMVVILY
jgi:hypothetical protein